MRDLLEKGEINGKPVRDGKQIADMLSEMWLKGALQGDFRFLKEILDRTEGKVPDRIAGHDGGNPTVEHLVKVVRVASMDDL
jgi:hypothetical protein